MFRYISAQNCSILGYYAASSDNFVPTFREHTGPNPQARVAQFSATWRRKPEMKHISAQMKL